MFHDPKVNAEEFQALMEMGTDAVAYMRQLTGKEIEDKFPGVPDLEANVTYWAMFAADGTPLMLAGDQTELENSAFYNDLTAILPN